MVKITELKYVYTLWTWAAVLFTQETIPSNSVNCWALVSFLLLLEEFANQIANHTMFLTLPSMPLLPEHMKSLSIPLI